MGGAVKHRLYEILEAGHPDDLASRIFDLVMVAIIVANVAAVAMETVASFDAKYGGAMRVFELMSVAIFTVEYLLRLWVADEHLPLRRYGPVMARVRFALGPYPIIDFLAFAPFYLSLILPAVDLRILRVFPPAAASQTGAVFAGDGEPGTSPGRRTAGVGGGPPDHGRAPHAVGDGDLLRRTLRSAGQVF